MPRTQPDRLLQTRESEWNADAKVWMVTITARHVPQCNDLCADGWHYLESKQGAKPPTDTEE